PPRRPGAPDRNGPRRLGGGERHEHDQPGPPAGPAPRHAARDSAGGPGRRRRLQRRRCHGGLRESPAPAPFPGHSRDQPAPAGAPLPLRAGRATLVGAPRRRDETLASIIPGHIVHIEERAMKDGLRFVDSDMHIMEPPDLFERYLDPTFKERVSVPVGADGRPCRGPASGLILIDGLPTSDADLQQYRKRRRPGPTQSTQPLSGSRLADTGRLDFAVERDYNAEAQIMGMELEGVDIAVLYPTTGLSPIPRDHLD